MIFGIVASSICFVKTANGRSNLFSALLLYSSLCNCPSLAFSQKRTSSIGLFKNTKRNMSPVCCRDVIVLNKIVCSTNKLFRQLMIMANETCLCSLTDVNSVDTLTVAQWLKNLDPCLTSKARTDYCQMAWSLEASQYQPNEWKALISASSLAFKRQLYLL